MRNEFIILFIGMALVTYVPRTLPALIIDKVRLGKKFEKFLKLIPYTAMSALIFPAVIGTDPERIYVGIAGALTAFLVSWKRLPVIAAVLSAIAVDLVIYLAVM